MAVVAAWLIMSPKCTAIRNDKCLRRANELAYVGGAEPLIGRLASQVYETERGLTFSEADIDLHYDESCSQPIYDYARAISWAQTAEVVYQHYRHAHDNTKRKVPCHGDGEWVPAPHRNENRLGTADDVVRYCGTHIQCMTDLPRHRRWDFLMACAAAIFLHWGSIGAAIVAYISSPPVVSLQSNFLTFTTSEAISRVLDAGVFLTSCLA